MFIPDAGHNDSQRKEEEGVTGAASIYPLPRIKEADMYDTRPVRMIDDVAGFVEIV